MTKTLLTVAFLVTGQLMANASLAEEARSCATASSVLSCGGVAFSDRGCSVTCPQNVGEDPICNVPECHPLAPEFVYLCTQGGGENQCVLGNDGAQWITIHSSCFCD